MQIVAEASNGQQLVMLTEKYQPDIIFTDIKMPMLDGVQATRLLSKKYPQISIIALSMFNDDNLIIDMLDAGARGYLLKNAQKEEILEAINTVYHNQMFYCGSIREKIAQLVAKHRINPKGPGESHSFNDREKEVMCMICDELSTKEISARMYLSVRTIEGYRERILQKTNAKNSAGIVLYAIRNNIYKP